MARVDPHSYFDDSQPRVCHWRLELSADFNRQTLSGTVALCFDKGCRRGVLDLDTKSLTVTRVFSETGKALPFELGAEQAVLGRRLRVRLSAGVREVHITYETSPTGAGLQWLTPEQTEGKKHPFLFTQCQPIHARSVLPCQDSATARVTYDAQVLAPAPLTAVMGAGPLGTGDGDAGRRVFRFRMPQPIPSYLFALAIGELEGRDLSPRSRVWAEPATIAAAAEEFSGTEAMIQSAESLFGPYDWERFDMLVLPPSFPYGGMENPRMTFLTPTLLAGDRSQVAVVAHELAHSWTGNLVTNATAEHFWLNEGFTVWAERRILRALRGDEAAALAWGIGQKDLEEALERFEGKPALTCLRTHLEGVDPDEAFSVVPYEKGARFVVALERAVGEERFDRFVKDYMKTFRFQSITTERFCAFVEASFPGLLTNINADAWLNEPGMPASAPRFVSRNLEMLSSLAQGWKDGIRPDPGLIGRWTPDEIIIYLQRLPREMSHEECAWLDGALSLTGRGNHEILTQWLCIAASSGYEPAFDRVRRLLTRVGRMKYVRPLYQALGRTEAGRRIAHEIFAQAGPAYHSLTRRAAQSLLDQYAVKA
ncbi:MAG: M1 family metallopeptidase [Elusimicrobiota bacterium]